MKNDIPELVFANRSDFREWLVRNAKTGDGVWLVFGKTDAVITLSANDALEEALCFGWIDGQMKSIDNTKYLKYFARRRAKSVWSPKNKKTVEALREKGFMTELGERAIDTAKKNGSWDDPLQNITAEQIEEFANRLSGISPAYENFQAMSPSAKLATVRQYLSVKSEELRQRNLAQIIESLNTSKR